MEVLPGSSPIYVCNNKSMKIAEFDKKELEKFKDELFSLNEPHMKDTLYLIKKNVSKRSKCADFVIPRSFKVYEIRTCTPMSEPYRVVCEPNTKTRKTTKDNKNSNFIFIILGSLFGLVGLIFLGCCFKVSFMS